MKNQFHTPEVEVINFSVEDLILLSSGGLTEEEGSGESGVFGEMFG